MKPEKMREIQEPVTSMWKSPPVSIYKVNWNVAMDKQNKRIDMSIIVWDNK